MGVMATGLNIAVGLSGVNLGELKCNRDNELPRIRCSIDLPDDKPDSGVLSLGKPSKSLGGRVAMKDV